MCICDLSRDQNQGSGAKPKWMWIRDPTAVYRYTEGPYTARMMSYLLVFYFFTS